MGASRGSQLVLPDANRAGAQRAIRVEREKEREDGKEEEGRGKREGREKGSRKKGWREDKRKENSKAEERNLLLFHKFEDCCQMTVDTVKHTNNLSC